MNYRLATIILAILAGIATGDYGNNYYKNYQKSYEYQTNPHTYQDSYPKNYNKPYHQDYQGSYPQDYNENSYSQNYYQESYQPSYNNHYQAPGSYNHQPYPKPYNSYPSQYNQPTYHDVYKQPYDQVNFVKPPYTRPFEEDYDTFKNLRDEENRDCGIYGFDCSKNCYRTFPYAPLKTTNFIPHCPIENGKRVCYLDNYYRSFDGTCNNLKYSWWGSIDTPYDRLAPSTFLTGGLPRTEDGEGNPLPIASLVGQLFELADPTVVSGRNTLYTFFGLMVGYDIAFTAKDENTDCTQEACDTMNPKCFNIEVGMGDCIKLNRADDIDFDCDDITERTPFSYATHFLDLHPLYGFNDQQNKNLRVTGEDQETKKGQLMTSIVPGSTLASAPVSPTTECMTAGERHRDCFRLGDVRFGDVSQLTSIHIFFLRYHNDIATKLAELNSHWLDEKVFQETRKIVIAVYQHIIYSEYLPYLLGNDLMTLFDLVPLKKGYFNGYDDYVYPNAYIEAIGAAFRLHQSVSNNVYIDSTIDNTATQSELHESMNNNYQTYNNLDDVNVGLFMGTNLEHRFQMADSLNNRLDSNFPNMGDMSSLGAINIQRGRDLGLATYSEIRKKAGLDNSFKNIASTTVTALNGQYNSIDDVDLFAGCLAEESMEIGMLLGPTCGYVVAKQFFKLKYGDRFYYENNNAQYTGFTLEQLDEIRKTSISTVSCNALQVNALPGNGFLDIDLSDADDSLVYCSNIFQLNLNLWAQISDSSQEGEMMN